MEIGLAKIREWMALEDSIQPYIFYHKEKGNPKFQQETQYIKEHLKHGSFFQPSFKNPLEDHTAMVNRRLHKIPEDVYRTFLYHVVKFIFDQTDFEGNPDLLVGYDFCVKNHFLEILGMTRKIPYGDYKFQKKREKLLKFHRKHFFDIIGDVFKVALYKNRSYDIFYLVGDYALDTKVFYNKKPWCITLDPYGGLIRVPISDPYFYDARRYKASTRAALIKYFHLLDAFFGVSYVVPEGV